MLRDIPMHGIADGACGLIAELLFLTGDIDLLAKLEDELKHEKTSDIPEFNEQQEIIDEIIKHGEWQVKDVQGDQEVILSKKFGNET
jgi:complement component 1 Q subcomponent-binding protein